MDLDLNRESTEDNELVRERVTSAYDERLSKGRVVSIEEIMKNMNKVFEDQREPSKLLTMYTISKEYSREQVKVKKWLSIRS